MLRDLLRAALPPALRELPRRARDAAELGQLDPQTCRAWIRAAPAVHAALGEEVLEAYTRLVIAAARRQAELGRVLARGVPDQIARVEPARRDEYFQLLSQVIRENPDASLLVARNLPELLERLEGDELRSFLKLGVDLHGEGTRKAESFLRRESRAGREELERLERGVRLQSVNRVLTGYARAHCGEDVQVRPSGEQRGVYSDGRHVYLPAQVERYGDERDFLVYRVATARAVGHLEFGTYDLDLAAVDGAWPDRRAGELELERLFRAFPNRVLARDLFQVAEDARIERQIREEYPGIARDMDVLAPDEHAERPDPAEMAPAAQAVELLHRRSRGAPEPPASEPRIAAAVDAIWAALEPATREGATVGDVAAALPAIYPSLYGLMFTAEPEDRPPQDQTGSERSFKFDGRGDPDEVGEEPRERPSPGGRGASEDEGDEHEARQEDLGTAGIRFDALSPEDRELEMEALDARDALRDQGAEVALEELRRAFRKGRPDADEFSYEEMVAFLERMGAPDGGVVEEEDEERPREANLMSAEGEAVRAEGEREFIYREWDAAIEDYKPSWVRLKEYVLEPGSREFVDRVREEHGHDIRRLRRRFEALRPQAWKMIRALPDGDELDLDRVVAARVTRRAGGSPTTRLYQRQLRERRDVAVAFLVDMSSSTNEVVGGSAKRIIEIEKEALVLVSEALDAIGDACAIYGFSGYGREQVAFYVAKDFGDAYDDRIRERIGQIGWKMENRDGAAIRHAARKLAAAPARSRLLILLSDGRPLDCGCDHYYDHYAQEDTRIALREARQLGVHPFCITVDPRGRSYLEAMYGEVGYAIIDDASKLPDHLPKIYRRLTT